MTIQINGESFPLLPRVAVMLKLLMRYQGDIEQRTAGHIEFDYSPGQVKIKLPPEQDLEKIPREGSLTKEKTQL